MKMVKGDITDDITHPCIIMHGCNCFNTMGAGVAKYLATKWPAVRVADSETLKGDRNKLGTVIFVNVVFNPLVTVANCYTQYTYWKKDQRQVNYEAVYRCIEIVNQYALKYGITDVRAVKIGCGLAKGNWHVVKSMFEVVMPYTTIYTL